MIAKKEGCQQAKLLTLECTTEQIDGWGGAEGGIIKGARKVLRVVAICVRYLDCGGRCLRTLQPTKLNTTDTYSLFHQLCLNESVFKVLHTFYTIFPFL